MPGAVTRVTRKSSHVRSVQRRCGERVGRWRVARELQQGPRAYDIGERDSKIGELAGGTP